MIGQVPADEHADVELCLRVPSQRDVAFIQPRCFLPIDDPEPVLHTILRHALPLRSRSNVVLRSRRPSGNVAAPGPPYTQGPRNGKRRGSSYTNTCSSEPTPGRGCSTRLWDHVLRSTMRATIGTVLLVAGVAALVVVPHSRPETHGCPDCLLSSSPIVHTGLSWPLYEIALSATYAALIIGAVLLAFALVRAWKDVNVRR